MLLVTYVYGDGTNANTNTNTNTNHEKKRQIIAGPSTPLRFAERDRISPFEILAGHAGMQEISKALERAARNNSTPLKPARSSK
ncbi:MAG: hypothetical protein ACP5T3_00185 [Candidatus Micrarchaeia archaeon]